MIMINATCITDSELSDRNKYVCSWTKIVETDEITLLCYHGNIKFISSYIASYSLTLKVGRIIAS